MRLLVFTKTNQHASIAMLDIQAIVFVALSKLRLKIDDARIPLGKQFIASLVIAVAHIDGLGKLPLKGFNPRGVAFLLSWERHCFTYH